MKVFKLNCLFVKIDVNCRYVNVCFSCSKNYLDPIEDTLSEAEFTHSMQTAPFLKWQWAVSLKLLSYLNGLCSPIKLLADLQSIFTV